MAWLCWITELSKEPRSLAVSVMSVSQVAASMMSTQGCSRYGGYGGITGRPGIWIWIIDLMIYHLCINNQPLTVYSWAKGIQIVLMSCSLCLSVCELRPYLMIQTAGFLWLLQSAAGRQPSLGHWGQLMFLMVLIIHIKTLLSLSSAPTKTPPAESPGLYSYKGYSHTAPVSSAGKPQVRLCPSITSLTSLQ